MQRENFIQFLQLSTPEELNKRIEEKGKEPRLKQVYVRNR